MPVQFNLLPDVKYQYLKAKRLQRLVVSVSSIAVAACVAILVLLFLWVDVWQKHTISSTTTSINEAASKIQSIDGLDKIITIQNQLKSLPGLYAQDPQASRIFNYIVKLTPPNVTISDLSIDFSQNTMEIKGEAHGLDDVNAYTDNLKKATYDDKTSGDKGVAAFSDVQLSNHGSDPSGASYTIDVSFDSILFQPSEEVVLHVPKETNIPQVPGVNGQVFKAARNLSEEEK